MQADARIQGEKQKSTFYPNALINLEGMLARIEMGLEDLKKQKIDLNEEGGTRTIVSGKHL